jgi:deazaflavin-dependent oxidoreductase (nitroreductase family)
MYRVTNGRLGGEMRGFKVLILNTIGRKSGKVHSNTVGYFMREDGYLIVGSNGGLSTHPAWFHNLKANPKFTIQVKEKVMEVHARILSGEERASLWQWVIETAPAFADYEKQTTREIPLVLLQPQ